MPRIVLDTNCLLQILGARSQYHFLFSAFLEGAYSLCVSTEILLEYEEILRVKASPVAADLFMKVIARSHNVERKDPYFHLGIVKQDPDDNKFVDCAFVSQADYIVTDDKHFDDVAQSEFPQFMVVGLDAFAEIMRNKNS
jgi:putative PIN family toxin of toxin-antitoxin system